MVSTGKAASSVRTRTVVRLRRFESGELALNETRAADGGFTASGDAHYDDDHGWHANVFGTLVWFAQGALES